MHETGLASEIRRASLLAAEEYGPGHLERVTVAIGELSAVEPELLVFAWQAAVSGTPDEGCELVVEWHPARPRCPKCDGDKPGTPGSWLWACPDCGTPLVLTGGRELDLLQVSFIPNMGNSGGDDVR
jgi:hydrogenase nickel incorporation protein HypA/HybF